MKLKGKTQNEIDREKEIQELKDEIEKCKHELNETDWVVVKIIEYDRVGKTIDEYKWCDYANILDTRERNRVRIRQAENRLATIERYNNLTITGGDNG